MARLYALLRQRRIWIPLVLIALYGLFGFLIAPRILRDQIIAAIRKTYGREVRLARVRVNPFLLSISLEGFELHDPDGPVFLQFDRLYLDFQLSSLVRWALTFREISLGNPYVHVRLLPGGRTNFTDLIPKESGPTPRLVVGRLSLSHGSVQVTNLMAHQPEDARIEPIDLDVRNFTTIPDHRGLYTIEATDPGGGRWRWTGGLTTEPAHAAGAIEVQGSQLRPLWKILQHRVPFEITDGRFGCRLNYAVDVKGDTVLARLDSTSLKLSGLALRAKGVDPQLLRLDSLIVRGIRVRYPEQTASIERVLVAGPQIAAWLNPDRTLNWLAMLPPAGKGATPAAAPAATGRHGQAGGAPAGRAVASAAPHPSPPAAAATGWDVGLSELAIRDLSLGFEDRTVRPPFTVSIEPLNLTVRNISTRPGARLDVETDMRIQGRGTFTCSGAVVATPLSADLTLSLSDLPLTMFQPYLSPVAKLQVVGGTVGFSGNATYRDQQPTPDVHFQGRAESKDFLTRDRIDHERFLSWKAVNVDGIEATLARVRVATVRVIQPYAKFIVHRDRTTNVQDILGLTPATADSAGINSDWATADTVATPATAPATAPVAAAAKAPHAAHAAHAAAPKPNPVAMPAIRVRSVEVRNGSADFADLSLILPFAARIQNLMGKVTGLSSDSSTRARVEVDGNAEPSGTARVRGEMNPLAQSQSLDLTVLFHDFNMPTLTPYSGQFLGRELDRGKMSLDLQYRLEGKHLVGENKILLDQLELGKKVDSPEATKIPVGLAIAILKDGDGQIHLDVPVEGNVDDPKFKIGRVILQFLKSLLVKVATAPFALLGAVFGGGHSDQLSHVDFALGTSDLAPDQQASLGKLAEALGKRPQLRLEVRGRSDADSDAAALRGSKLAAQAAEKIEQNPKKYGGGLGYSERLLEDLYTERFGKSALHDLRDHHQVEAGSLPAADPQYKAGSKKQVVDEATLRVAMVDSLTAHQTVDAAELLTLANARGSAIKQALVTQGVAESRVYVVEPEPGKAEGGRVRIDLKLTD